MFEILKSAKSPAEAQKMAREAGADVSPPILHVLSLFNFGHLPPHLQDVSARFAELAADIASRSSNQETTVALRKLLEAKDAGVRAALLG